MPKQSEARFASMSGTSVLVYRLDRSWQHSPRINGKLVLRSNPYSYLRATVGGFTWDRATNRPPTQPPVGSSLPAFISAQDRAYAQAYARLRGKLYAGGASLGVTLGSLGKSRDMIEKRVKTLNTNVVTLTRDVLSSKRKGKDASGLILETFFGWQPLISDIYAATTTVIQGATNVSYVRATGQAEYTWSDTTDDKSHTVVQAESGTARCTLAAAISISNPNLWLAERAGLLNPVAVAWDLVPWSFMVNAFSNMGGLVNSITDFTGLSFSGGTQTRSLDMSRGYTSVLYQESHPNKGAASSATYRTFTLGRSLSGVPHRPPLVVRAPELNLKTAAIGLALAVQNMRALSPFYKLGQITLKQFRSRGH